jgi:hypothetical protein
MSLDNQMSDRSLTYQAEHWSGREANAPEFKRCHRDLWKSHSDTVNRWRRTFIDVAAGTLSTPAAYRAAGVLLHSTGENDLQKSS